MVLFISICVFFSLFVMTLRTGISPMPSSKKAVRGLIDTLPDAFNGRIVDIGSGWGTVCHALSKAFPEATIIGVERSLIPYLFSLLIRRKNCQIFYADFRKTLPVADVYYCYLFPKGMEYVKKTLVRKNIQKAVIISKAFALPGVLPRTVKMMGGIYPTPLYTYAWNLEELYGDHIL